MNLDKFRVQIKTKFKKIKEELDVVKEEVELLKTKKKVKKVKKTVKKRGLSYESPENKMVNLDDETTK